MSPTCDGRLSSKSYKGVFALTAVGLGVNATVMAPIWRCAGDTPKADGAARVDNVFNNHYATYATFFDTTQLPNFNTGNPFTNPDSLSPARPLAAYVGIKATF